MSPSSSLTCNFTIETSLSIGVSFQSSDGGASYGGLITIFTPGTAGPVTTGLWDSDGNVFFTIYLSENPSLSCTINSGSTPGTWNPYVAVAKDSGLTCTISGPEQTDQNTYGYTLSVSLSKAGGTGETKEAARTTAPPAARHIASMVLPAGGMEAWTQIMQGASPVPNEINTGSPIVMAWARFDDGTQVGGGVSKSETPTDYNVKFMWVLDANGNQYPGWPIDVSDDEDFLTTAYFFSLTPDGESYLLNVIESQL